MRSGLVLPRAIAYLQDDEEVVSSLALRDDVLADVVLVPLHEPSDALQVWPVERLSGT